jgi:hypothetical protein
MKTTFKIIVLLITVTLFVQLTFKILRAPARNRDSAAIHNNCYTQLEIGDILFGKSQSAKLKLLGSPINLEGKVLKSRLLKDNEIIVYRAIMTCCAADTVPLGVVVQIPVETDGGAQFLKTVRDHDWVNVEGTLKLLPCDAQMRTIVPVANLTLPDQVVPCLIATKAAKVAAPRDEYLYP